MAQGQLQVTGTIDISQFWPSGSSDADTAKIIVDVGSGDFRFRPQPGSNFQVTRAFDNAIVVGRVRKPAIQNDRITVRLQGIDAPELHYRPSAVLRRNARTDEQHRLYLEVNEEYRQNLAETATVNLKQLLENSGQNPLACTLLTAVDEPDEVFDTYGRFVGDIFISDQGQPANINTWLVRNGWAFPAFYNSMSKDEILTLWNAADQAWADGLGVWPHLVDGIGRLDWDLQYRRPSQNPLPDAVADAGGVILPKLFRRLSTWEISRYALMVQGSFMTYLRDRPDYFLLTDEFLDQAEAAPLHRLDEFIEGGDFLLWPEQLVFRESPSRLIGPGGAAVNW